jgi:hypothetical protein
MSPADTCRAFLALGIVVDQIIQEFGVWAHIAIARPGEAPRGEQLTAYKVAGMTRYEAGIHD